MHILTKMLVCLRVMLFTLLLFLRKPFLLCATFISVVTFLAFLIALYMDTATNMKVGFFLFSFGSFLLKFFYDQLIIKLNPTNNELILSQ